MGTNSAPSDMSANLSPSEGGDYVLNITAYYQTGECEVSYEPNIYF